MKNVMIPSTLAARSAIFALFSFLAIALVLLLPTSAIAYPGGCHYWGAEAGVELFGIGPSNPAPDPNGIDRDRQTPLYPELSLATEWYDPADGCCEDEDLEWKGNWDWVREAAQERDDYGDSWGRNHFWFPEEGLHECPNDVAGLDNAWETMEPLWILAITGWMAGNLGQAYANLGYVLHFIEDMGQPAHANEDFHPGGVLDDDSLEEWISGQYCRDTFQWQAGSSNAPQCIGCGGDSSILEVPMGNAAILNDMLSPASYWEGSAEVPDEPFLPDPNSLTNVQQLFYILYVVNQTANWFASDGETGNTTEPIGWLDYSNFPNCLHDDPGNPTHCVSAWDSDGLADNDDNNTDHDGDLSLIARWGYGTAFRAVPAVLNLFRRTVDNAPPISTVVKTRLDGEPLAFWNNSPVTVHITGATDYGNPGFLPSGVWKLWGRVDGVTPANENDPSWGISEDGIHTIEYLSTDWLGNVEVIDGTVRIDMTPPEITFPDLKPLYLTSENFTATWVAVDALSGVDYETAYLNGQLVDKGDVIDLALMAGMNQLEVYATDVAGNIGYAIYEFEVVIDAGGWCFPVLVSDKTRGKSMFCAVEFPAPYDVGLIDYTTSDLVVNGIELPATRITGVGDSDGDHNRDRMLRFDKEQFVAAIAGLVGDVGAEIWGGLLPDGMPRFVADVTVPVFGPPRAK